VLDSGLVPGNRNADNIDIGLSENDHLVFPDHRIQKTDLKAFSLTSFGFGKRARRQSVFIRGICMLRLAKLSLTSIRRS
jgi:3-oxoacyl-(acyl-carrier-protein) synthase